MNLKIKAAAGVRVKIKRHKGIARSREDARLNPQQKVQVEKFLAAHPNQRLCTVAAKLGLTKSLVDAYLESAGRAVAQSIAAGSYTKKA